MTTNFRLGLELTLGFTGLIRWIERNRPDLNLGRCPPGSDGEIRAVMTIALGDPDSGVKAGLKLPSFRRSQIPQLRADSA